MTPERERLLEAVAEAAEILEGGAYVIRGRTPEDADIYAHELGHIRYLMKCTAALRAHDAAHPRDGGEVVGETVDLAVWQDKCGFCVLVKSGSEEDERKGDIWRRLGTVTLPVIPATVEEVKR